MARKTLAQSDPRVAGGRYRSGYWGEEYAVITREDRDGIAWFTVRWADDNRITTHCTPWDARRDTIVSVPE